MFTHPNVKCTDFLTIHSPTCLQENSLMGDDPHDMRERWVVICQKGASKLGGGVHARWLYRVVHGQLVYSTTGTGNCGIGHRDRRP